jgi:hypothetical protein
MSDYTEIEQYRQAQLPSLDAVGEFTNNIDDSFDKRGTLGKWL